MINHDEVETCEACQVQYDCGEVSETETGFICEQCEAKKPVLFVSFSGGRTSAYMCSLLQSDYSSQYRFIFVYANTGLEAEGTLEFVDKCDKEFGLNLNWLEADVQPAKGSPIEFKAVTFKTASRLGEPMAEIVAKHGIPNSGRPFCTQYLKTYVINAFKNSLGYKRSHKTAIGIRSDEFDRMNHAQIEKGETVYPLITWKHTTKPDVLMFFKDAAFDLEIKEIEGNCVTCFKKSDRHLFTLAKHNPEYFEVFNKLEEKYGHIDAKSGDPFRFFRGNKSVADIIASSTQPFREFNPELKEFQLSFSIDPLDKSEGCGEETCEG